MHTGFAFARQTNTITRIHTWRNLHRKRFSFFYTTRAMTFMTGVFNGLALPLTTRTGLLHSKETLLHAHLTHTATGRTVFGMRTLGCTRTITTATAHHGGHTDFNLSPFNGIFQIQAQTVSQIRASLYMAALTTTARGGYG